ncbi:hypothetical protein ARMA_2053 [Ardenticatena maritima]|uniref:Uncharacterized protein n=1 Tax=Ardenticatena maritima TaxID=872965 RepID=A0A0M9UD74_9CHLR|nr:hypothetical protein ARMA_2053 [Ardenticatena maritima]
MVNTFEHLSNCETLSFHMPIIQKPHLRLRYTCTVGCSTNERSSLCPRYKKVIPSASTTPANSTTARFSTVPKVVSRSNLRWAPNR